MASQKKLDSHEKCADGGKEAPPLRYEFVDLAKGFCILLVIIYHVDECKWLFSNEEVNLFFISFRMPFYFFLSGLFLSFSRGYLAFTERKVNRLLVPLLFFYLLSVLYVFVYHRVYSTVINPGYQQPIFDASAINFLYLEDANNLYPNLPIWFLWSLFTVYMLCMLLYTVTRGHLGWFSFLGLVLGGVGYGLSKAGINLPLYIDTSLTCIPFVMGGYVLRKKVGLLDAQRPGICLAISCICFFITYFSHAGLSVFYQNLYEGNAIRLWVSGISGSCGTFYLAKAIQHIPVVGYIGRYSIIALGIHALFLSGYAAVLDKFFPCSTPLRIIILLGIVIASCLLSIAILKKWTPWLVAQKDLIHFPFAKKL